MNVRLSNHRYKSLLFLILSTQFIFADLTRSKEHPFSFYATFTYKKEHKDKDNRVNSEQNEQEQRSFFVPKKEFYEKNKEFFETQKTFNNYPIYIPKYLKDEEGNKSSEPVKDIPSRGNSNFERDNSQDVRISMIYAAAAIKDRVTTIAANAKKTFIDATLVIPVALVKAYNNRRGFREEREFLEYDFDHIGQITDSAYKPNDQADNNTVYSVAAGIKVVEFIAEGVVIGTVATVNAINQSSKEEAKKEEQQKQEQKQEQSQKQPESNVVVKETVVFKDAGNDSAKKEVAKESNVVAKESAKEVKAVAKESATSKEVVKDSAKKETAKESKVAAKESAKEVKAVAKESATSKEVLKDSAKKETAKESKVAAKESAKEVKTVAKESAKPKEVLKDSAKKETAKESKVAAKESAKEVKAVAKESAKSKEVLKDSAKKETAKESKVAAKESAKEVKTAAKESATSKDVFKNSFRKEMVKESKVVAKESVKEAAKEPIKKHIEFLQSDIATIVQKDSEVSKLKAGQEAIKACNDQKAHNREKQDRVMEAGISFAIVSWLIPYDQQQKSARKEKAKEDCIQKRILEENKTRSQIEEEIRLADEQSAQDQRKKELKKQETEKRFKEEKQRLKEEKLEEKKKHKQQEKEKKQKQREEELRAQQEEKKLKEELLQEKKKYKQQKEKKQNQSDKDKKYNGSGPDKEPDKDPEKKPGCDNASAIIAAAKEYRDKLKDKFDKYKGKLDNPNKGKPSSQKDTRNYQPTQAEVLENQRWQNEYSNGKGVFDGSIKHQPNAPKGIGPEPKRPLDALRDSYYVNKKTRVAVQDGKIVMLRKHAETVDGFPMYHAYIEDNPHKVEVARNVLVDAGLIRPKSGKVYQ